MKLLRQRITQNPPFRMPQPIRVLPCDPNAVDPKSGLVKDGFVQLVIPSSFSRGRRSPYTACQIIVTPEGTFDFRAYGDVGDMLLAVQSDDRGLVEIFVNPHGQNHEGWTISLDKILFDCLQLSPTGGEF